MNLRRVLIRPELGACIAAIAIFALFASVAGQQGFLSAQGTINYLEISAQLGILATAVSLLMIAGEFDLSVGSMTGAAGMVIGIPVSQFGWPLWLAIIVALLFSLLVGYINGWLVVKTRLPSFIITLASLYLLRGLTIGLTLLFTNFTRVSGLRAYIEGDLLAPIFSGRPLGWPISIWWWVLLTVVLGWVLFKTAYGNWIFAAGGDSLAARNVGVPVARVKVSLFMLTAVAAALLAVIQVLNTGTTDVLRGEQKELQAIASAVIGGCLLTGGYGSVFGATIGALILGMVQQGIFYTGISTDWFKAVLGGMLLAAVLLNHFLRQQALRSSTPPKVLDHPIFRVPVDLHGGSTVPLRSVLMANSQTTLMEPIIELHGIDKVFGKVTALQDISFKLFPGEVHCLLGDNAAGKSTLIKILSGVHRPTRGEFRFLNRPVELASPREALDLGIATVFQDLAMLPLMSITRNFFLGREPKKSFGPLKVFDAASAEKTTTEELRKIGIRLRDPNQAVGTLSGGERQAVAIARAIYFGAKVLILDEPTSALGVKEAAVALKYTVQAKMKGIGVIFISHNVHHAWAVGDTFTVLNRGWSNGTFRKSETHRAQLLQMMAGGEELDKLAVELDLIAKRDTGPTSELEHRISEDLEAKDD